MGGVFSSSSQSNTARSTGKGKGELADQYGVVDFVDIVVPTNEQGNGEHIVQKQEKQLKETQNQKGPAKRKYDDDPVREEGTHDNKMGKKNKQEKLIREHLEGVDGEGEPVNVDDMDDMEVEGDGEPKQQKQQPLHGHGGAGPSSSENKPKASDLIKYVEKINENMIKIHKGLVPNMRTDGYCFVNQPLYDTLIEELIESTEHGSGGMLPSLKQVANVASLPGVVGSVAMPDIHCGYGFAIGNVAAVDMDEPGAVVSPGGVGFDINCGVRLIRTNLTYDDLMKGKGKKQVQLADTLYNEVPVGVGSASGFKCTKEKMDEILLTGMNALQGTQFVWDEDIAHVEETGCIQGADPNCVSDRAKKRGVSQVGTLGSGNHYAEVQVVEEIFNAEAASAMGITQVGQLCVMIHSGSRGLGHQVCTDYLKMMDEDMGKNKIKLNDRQLACVPIESDTGRKYLAGMAAAANFAFCNRSMMTHQVRRAFEKVFGATARELDMHVVYDVCHNIAKIEEHTLADGKTIRALVHRKGATRAFAPHHPSLPEAYKEIGQPVIVGGSMGTYSYVLTGTQKAMECTFGSTCHGAGRQLSRVQALRNLKENDVFNYMKEKGIELRIRNKKLVAEEASEAYKNISDVVDVCQDAGISL
eukprot:CAMPEP_0184694948 /NCGR_PEP_ID=MMETSP0313-20130426/2736_1 /TAXON_ID=2792 /ORGANISM="Porphyridium aerugineum, Strain SAG 1380-2" /LENGTH=641 /DNA_ID=CAMNT_0027153315 /DNA_START=117 /DNA_END=2039 /DNA_ORIENTATION=-